MYSLIQLVALAIIVAGFMSTPLLIAVGVLIFAAASIGARSNKRNRAMLRELTRIRSGSRSH